MPQQTVKGIMSQQGVPNTSKANQIMSAVRSSITVQVSQDGVTKQFDKFVLMLHNLTLDNLADLLVEKLGKFMRIHEVCST